MHPGRHDISADSGRMNWNPPVSGKGDERKPGRAFRLQDDDEDLHLGCTGSSSLQARGLKSSLLMGLPPSDSSPPSLEWEISKVSNSPILILVYE